MGKYLGNPPVRAIVNPNQHIVFVNYFDYVATLLQKLSEAKVLAAVVTVKEKPGVVGFVDVLDIIHSVIESTNSSIDFASQPFQDIQWEGKTFNLEHSGSLINKSKRDEMLTVSLDTPLSTLAEMFAMEVHRVGVIEDGKLLHIVSQSDLVEYLARRGVYIGSKLAKPLKDVGLEALGVASVLESLSALEVIRFMRQHTLSGVPVLDSHGRIVCNFSATDLLGLNESNFPTLSLPVKEYLSRMYGFPKAPVCATETDTVEFLILKMAVHKVHRIYIVDHNMKPTGVITMTDLMQFFIAE